MRQLEYGSSLWKPWIQCVERALQALARDFQNWRKMLLALLCGVIVLAAALVLLVALLIHLEQPRKVADIPGPAPTYRPGELWFGNHGNLTFHRWGGPIVTLRDYTGDTNVTHVHWPANDRVVMTMSDGSTLQFAVGWSATPPTTRRLSP